MRFIMYNTSTAAGQIVLSHLRCCLTRLIYKHYYPHFAWLMTFTQTRITSNNVNNGSLISFLTLQLQARAWLFTFLI